MYHIGKKRTAYGIECCVYCLSHLTIDWVLVHFLPKLSIVHGGDDRTRCGYVGAHASENWLRSRHFCALFTGNRMNRDKRYIA